MTPGRPHRPRHPQPRHCGNGSRTIGLSDGAVEHDSGRADEPSGDGVRGRSDDRTGRPAGCRAAEVVRWPCWDCGVGRAGPVLSAAGIALGIATMVAVLGISDSSRSQLVAQIDRPRHKPVDGDARPIIQRSEHNPPQDRSGHDLQDRPRRRSVGPGRRERQRLPEQPHLAGQHRGHHRLFGGYRPAGHRRSPLGQRTVPQRGERAFPGRRTRCGDRQRSRRRPG